MFIKIFFTRKQLNSYINKEIKKLVDSYQNSVVEQAYYFDDLKKENAKLKDTVEKQNSILNAIRIIKEVLK